ncbi:MAG: AbrB/MazE/SpoVT family DNA-binding domain-containing protein [Dehalococcoidia bacterium]|nr:AbrB/MazE/SpoVT family DNA-binding domain-containing protein [Dehalococcoidia bacterium]
MVQTIDASVRVGRQGRLVIPAEIRKRLGVKEGDRLLMRLQGERLVLETRAAVLARVKGAFADVPRDVSLVEELLADRRAEAAREEEG